LWPDQPSFTKLLQAVRRPAEDTSDGEGWSEQFSRQSQTMQQQGSVEFDIGIEAPVWLAFAEQAKRRGFNALREVI